MAQLPPGARGFLIGEQSQQQMGLGNLAQVQGILGIQGEMQKQQEMRRIMGERAELSMSLSKLPEIANNPVLLATARNKPEALLPYLMPRQKQDLTHIPIGAGGTLLPDSSQPGGYRTIEPIRPQKEPAPFGNVHNVPGGYIEIQPDGSRKFVRTQQEPREPTPPLTKGEVVDPKNPNQMLSVDLRVYKPGGSLGDPGVFGVAGKEPSAAKKDEKSAEGKDLLKTELDNMREHYRVLNESRAIPSSERGSASNAAAWVQGSSVGQLGGRILGTKEQDARNQIMSSRLRIMNAIKSATGMSAQQLNSNVELKTWLDSMTNLGNTYESNIGIIDSIEQTYLKDKPKAPNASPQGGWTDL